MAVARRETVRTDEDGTVEVDNEEYVDALKRAGFEVADDSEGEEESDDTEGDLEDLNHDELKAVAEEEGIADEIDLRSKDSILNALQDREDTTDGT